MTGKLLFLFTTAFYLLGASVNPAGAADTLYDHMAENSESPFYDFKQNGVETFCTVPSVGESPGFGAADIAPQEAAIVGDAEARKAYECIKSDMRDGYAKSGHPHATDYMDWQAFSTGPYPSRAHMRRYVNNYANKIAAPYYGRYEQSGKLPVGSIVAKDSFVISKGGRVVFSALAMMEKMPPGFNPTGGDWRFTLILPDGRLFGSTNAEDEYTVEFCQKCHIDAGADRDFLFFLPNKYRVNP